MRYLEKLLLAYRAAPFTSFSWALFLYLALELTACLLVIETNGWLLKAITPVLALLFSPLLSLRDANKVRSRRRMRYKEKVWTAYRHAPFTTLTWAFFIFLFISIILALLAPHFEPHAVSESVKTDDSLLGVALTGCVALLSLLIAPLPATETEEM